MENLIYLDDFLDSKIDYGELFAECLEDVVDDVDIYATKGTVYEVVNRLEDVFDIDTGSCTLRFKRDDPDFKLCIIKGGI